MILQHSAHDRTDVNRALEVSIYVGVTALLATACLLILLPFIPLIAWAIIIAVASYPGFRNLQRLLRGREVLASVLFTIIFLAVLILPCVLLAQSVVEGIQSVTAHVKDGVPLIPPPPPTVEKWPIVGGSLTRIWGLASKDLSELVRMSAPQIKAVLPDLLSASAVIGVTVLQLLLSIVVAGVILANHEAAYQVTCSLFNRLFGGKGPEFQQLVGATIRSVTFGVLGVAAIQSTFAALGFVVVGLPAAGLWAVLFLAAAVLQVGIFVIVPAAVYVFVTASTTKAVIFLIWCVIVALMDNVLKPLLMGRGVAVPVIVVFLGAIGGFMTMSIIGLFVGAVVLSVGYKLLLAWLEEGAATHLPGQVPRPTIAASD